MSEYISLGKVRRRLEAELINCHEPISPRLRQPTVQGTKLNYGLLNNTKLGGKWYPWHYRSTNKSNTRTDLYAAIKLAEKLNKLRSCPWSLEKGPYDNNTSHLIIGNTLDNEDSTCFLSETTSGQESCASPSLAYLTDHMMVVNTLPVTTGCRNFNFLLASTAISDTDSSPYYTGHITAVLDTPPKPPDLLNDLPMTTQHSCWCLNIDPYPVYYPSCTTPSGDSQGSSYHLQPDIQSTS